MRNNLPTESQNERPAKAGDDSFDASAFLAKARARYEAAYAREEHNILAAYEDLEFLSGKQWDQDAEAVRTEDDRPCMTVNQLPQFVAQVTGDIRQSRPAMRAAPVDSRGDEDTADVIAGLFRYIENRSVAKAAYYSGADQQVAAGQGAWRVDREYADEITLNQELRIVPIEDAISVLFDPDAVEGTKADGAFTFVPYDLSRLAFKEKHPDASESAPPGTDLSRWFAGWYGEDYIRVVEYWEKRPVKKLVAVDRRRGTVDEIPNDPASIKQARDVCELENSNGGDCAIEERDGVEIWRSLISACDVLEKPQKQPGRFIPIVRARGVELSIGRKKIRHGVVRFAKDPQRTYNYFVSAQAEVVALQPKAPFIGTAKQFEGFEHIWAEANNATTAFLPYNADPLVGGAPQRSQPPVASEGIDRCRDQAGEDIMKVIGIYKSDLGDAGNETSGKAILARQRQGDTGTYVYSENFSQAVAHTAAIVIDLIPHVYDTARTIRILGEDGQTVESVEINKPEGMAENGAVERVLNDLTIGAYDVVAQMGPAFATRREEARDSMTEIIRAAPDLAPIILDLLAGNMDWPQADELKERLEAIAPPAIQALIAKRKGIALPAEKPDPRVELDQAKLQQEGDIAAGEFKAKMRELAVKDREIDLKLAEINRALEEMHFKPVAEALASHTAANDAAAKAAAAPAAPAPSGDAFEERFARLEHVVQGLAHMIDQVAGAGAPPPVAMMPPGAAVADPALLPA